MSLIIASGANLGNQLQQLQHAKLELQKYFELEAESRVYTSAAVDYEAQPDFFNQVLQFKIPSSSPDEVMLILLNVEKELGRTRDIWRGPRTIDLDIILWGLEKFQTEHVVIPHPRWTERSFVVRPLSELPFFKTVEKCFIIPESFKVEATLV